MQPPNFYGVPDEVRALLSPVAPPSPPLAATPVAATPISFSSGQRIALCVGNDGFDGNLRLYGCQNDARAWADTFRGMGYQVAEPMLDASADQIRQAIQTMVGRASPGDSLAIHISSHGTQVPDLGGDEAEDSQYADGLDEAVIGIDYAAGGMIIDDEWPTLLNTRQGVHIVRFHDFCHAGRTSRMLLSPTRRTRSVHLSEKVALLGAQMATQRGTRGGTAYGEDVPYVTFCACLPSQLAGEEQGQGLFSRAATMILRGQGAGLSANDLAAAISRAMASAGQDPIVEGPERLRALPITEPVR